MNNNMDKNELIKLKAELICKGIKINETSEKVYDMEHKTKIKRTSNMGLQLLLADDMIVSVPYNENSTSKYYLYEKENKTFLTDDHLVVEVKPFPFTSPLWYDEKLENGEYVSNYIQKEGKDVLICSITESCCYFSKSEQCAFCALNGKMNSNKHDRIKSIIEALVLILKKDDSVKSINLTGGNLYTSDKGALQYISILKAVRAISNIPVVVEISPPDDLQVLEELKEAGATAIELNLEIWDEKIRKMMMPGKAKITRDYYIKSWKKSVELFGKGNVGSAIIIGLESSASSLEGIRKMIEVGCLPSIIPFKPTEKSLLENFRKCSPEEVLYVTKEASKMLRSQQLSPVNGPGCIGCSACTLESDMYKLDK